jgi:hypothetical protein
MRNADLDTTKNPVYLEIRGKEIVVVRGPAVNDPDALPGIVGAAFGEGLPKILPVPAESPSTTALFLKDDTFLISSSDVSTDFAKSFGDAQTKAEEEVAEDHPGFTQNGDQIDFVFDSGLNGFVENAGGTKIVAIAHDDEQRKTINRFRQGLKVKQDTAQRGKEFEGASNTLNGLFD